MANEEIRAELVRHFTAYQDAASRNALAESPAESAEYVMSLFSRQESQGSREQQIREIKLLELCNLLMWGMKPGMRTKYDTKTIKEIIEIGKELLQPEPTVQANQSFPSTPLTDDLNAMERVKREDEDG